jgi:hypothetical protein
MLTAFERFLKGETTPEENRSVVRKLLAGAPTEEEVPRRLLRRLGEAPQSPDAYDEAFERLSASHLRLGKKPLQPIIPQDDSDPRDNPIPRP